MTDRIRHLTVVLDRDYRDDDLKEIISAIKHLRPVASVKAHVVEAGDYINREVVRSEMELQLYEAIRGVFEDAKNGKRKRER
jgi:hypothetical protein